MRKSRVGRGTAAFIGTVTLLTVVLIAGAAGADARPYKVHAKGDLIRYDNPYGDGTPNPVLEGARASVKAHAHGKHGTTVTLHVHGLEPNREFGSHVHILGCNDNKAGGHYRNDPAAPASPQNEIWLDFVTDAHGNGSAKATVDWTFRPDGANAVIIHTDHTASSGAAGAKLACLDVDF
jgi:Cu-Zn family superoxide dismutase